MAKGKTKPPPDTTIRLSVDLSQEPETLRWLKSMRPHERAVFVRAALAAARRMAEGMEAAAESWPAALVRPGSAPQEAPAKGEASPVNGLARESDPGGPPPDVARVMGRFVTG